MHLDVRHAKGSKPLPMPGLFWLEWKGPASRFVVGRGHGGPQQLLGAGQVYTQATSYREQLPLLRDLSENVESVVKLRWGSES